MPPVSEAKFEVLEAPVAREPFWLLLFLLLQSGLWNFSPWGLQLYFTLVVTVPRALKTLKL